MVGCNRTAKLTSSNGKIIQYKDRLPWIYAANQFQVLDKPLDLDKFLTYFLFPVLYIFATTDGFFAKTNKAKVLHHLLEN